MAEWGFGGRQGWWEDGAAWWKFLSRITGDIAALLESRFQNVVPQYDCQSYGVAVSKTGEDEKQFEFRKGSKVPSKADSVGLQTLELILTKRVSRG